MLKGEVGFPSLGSFGFSNLISCQSTIAGPVATQSQKHTQLRMLIITNKGRRIGFQSLSLEPLHEKHVEFLAPKHPLVI